MNSFLNSTDSQNLQRNKECPVYDTQQSDGGAFGNAEYPFIAIAHKPTLVRWGSS